MAWIAEWSGVLSTVAIGITLLFIFWYLLTMVIVGRAIRDPETGEIVSVTLDLFYLIFMWMAQDIIIIQILSRVPLPPDLIMSMLVLDAWFIYGRTRFMWHLQLEALYREWKRNRQERKR